VAEGKQAGIAEEDIVTHGKKPEDQDLRGNGLIGKDERKDSYD
jgi:hypothetical protein